MSNFIASAFISDLLQAPDKEAAKTILEVGGGGGGDYLPLSGGTVTGQIQVTDSSTGSLIGPSYFGFYNFGFGNGFRFETLNDVGPFQAMAYGELVFPFNINGSNIMLGPTIVSGDGVTTNSLYIRSAFGGYSATCFSPAFTSPFENLNAFGAYVDGTLQFVRDKDGILNYGQPLCISRDGIRFPDGTTQSTASSGGGEGNTPSLVAPSLSASDVATGLYINGIKKITNDTLGSGDIYFYDGITLTSYFTDPSDVFVSQEPIVNLNLDIFTTSVSASNCFGIYSIGVFNPLNIKSVSLNNVTCSNNIYPAVSSYGTGSFGTYNGVTVKLAGRLNLAGGFDLAETSSISYIKSIDLSQLTFFSGPYIVLSRIENFPNGYIGPNPFTSPEGIVDAIIKFYEIGATNVFIYAQSLDFQTLAQHPKTNDAMVYFINNGVVIYLNDGEYPQA